MKLAEVSADNDPTSLEVENIVMGGFHFDLTNDFRLTPNVLIRQSINQPTSYEFNATITYLNTLSTGLTYRNKDAISLILGMQLNHILKAGYSYDYTLSEIKEESSGSHEIFIGLTLF